jgi:methylenetetrahydrofolate--tRNA-(uracil-5-)-methyltransferase
MRQGRYDIIVIGGGFAGVEAAWAAASRGSRVLLYEMRPKRPTAVHRTGDLAELVCSNSFKSNLLTTASGVLKEEMRRLGSLILPIAEKHRVPAGEALAVDRGPFAREVTETIESHPNIVVRREEVCRIPEDRPLVIATGPLTSEALAEEMKRLTGGESLYFYDAVAPTVLLDTVDQTKVFRASRRGKGAGIASSEDAAAGSDTSDYLNCPMNREEYLAFWNAVVGAELAPSHNPEDEKLLFFEMCVPIEELARRGEKTLAFGPMKPVGLTDPRTGRRPYAVVQLRQENREGTLWGLVGFQTRMKWGEQRRIFRMIPGLENAEFVRYGVMHRNTYICAPRLLDYSLQLREHPGLLMAGQITGVEGYLESAAIGLVAGLNAHRIAQGKEPLRIPRQTVLGSLCAYLVETDPKRFAPMNANFGIMPELPEAIRDKREKARRKAEIALAAIDRFQKEIEEWLCRGEGLARRPVRADDGGEDTADRSRIRR